MNILWSPRATILQNEILAQIRDELSAEDALRWYDRICEAVKPLGSFPNIGSAIPAECFERIPQNAERLRQTFCGPYRIVYEPIEDEIHILSIRHTRMLVADGDIIWD